jgi:ligand-binding SRPBCC domain-containing protein
MQSFRHSFSVDAEISKVWDFYTDLHHLEVITPPDLGIRVLKCTHQQLEEGSEVWLTGKLLTKSNWHSQITSLKPYEYIDEMLSGRFPVWKHAHKFRREGESRTEVIDEIDYELPFGLVGRLFDPYFKRRLEKTFRYREKATKAELEKVI